MTICNNKKGKEGERCSKVRDAGCWGYDNSGIIPDNKEDFQGSCYQRQNKEKVHFKHALPAMWRSGADSDRDGALLFVFRQIAPQLSRDAIT